MTTQPLKATTLGSARIGPRRELKRATESYWAGRISRVELEDVAAGLRRDNWTALAAAGLDSVPVNTFSYYDQVLDTAVLLGALPPRVAGIADDLDRYFAAARGNTDVTPLEMTKWFDTNYHYLVPEFSAQQEFSLHAERYLASIREAQARGLRVKPVLLGPVSFLWLGKCRDGSDRLKLLPKLLAVYRQLFAELQTLGIEWLQIDEPILVQDLTQPWQDALRTAYKNLQDYRLQLLLTTYFGGVAHHAGLIATLAVDGVHIDAVRGAADVEALIAALPAEKVLSLGVVDGRSIWRNDLRASLQLLRQAQAKFAARLWVASSCSLLHSPVDLDAETRFDDELKSWLAFARQKVAEVAVLARGLREGEAAIAAELAASDAAQASRRQSPRIHKPAVRERLAAVRDSDFQRQSAYEKRAELQRAALNLPLFPTTTIGSFPQTAEIRKLRAQYRRNEISEAAYVEGIRARIADQVRRQEALGLDVLVHGEAERNDMVEYFGEQLEGFAFSENGWVQSYGSRCVKPPLIYGDVSRPRAMTLDWTLYAQSLSSRPVKGMLTGPITILCWSFPRNDISRREQANQIALALRDEVQDLERAGIGIIQIDEPAIREGLPLRTAGQGEYLDWAVQAFRLATTGVADRTQIHTHMCYSEFNEIIAAIAALDADVITIETSRSQMDLLQAFEAFAYPNEIGPGVYDIHSPVVPDTAGIVALLEKAAQSIPRERLWVNPDCGLKTRAWPETEAALRNMVAAAHQLRRQSAAVIA